MKPCLKLSVGTVRLCDCSERSLRSSHEKKKNARFFTTGPPSEAPYWLRISFSRGIPARLENQLFAARLVLRLNSYRDPWKALEPLFVTTETCPPEDRPWSARCPESVVRNSFTESR